MVPQHAGFASNCHNFHHYIFIIAQLLLLAQWLEHSLYNRGVASLPFASSLISLLVSGIPVSSRTTVLLR